jgi:chromosome segregation protein
MRVYLKRIEVQGFKSFAGKSSFEFGPGVTALVGPNGSGKSNLADAVRWVLGEQNPRALRSRKADEIIFAGSRGRPAAGLAEVSIALDNTAGWLPIGFDEVVLTRRLHRSGDSEYLVNRARVRLKDMVDLLSRARVGQNSYAIMGQGLVDQVLNLPPIERRTLIEEAADVRRHRIKIQDAVDRLGATRDNLDRVGLLVGEIAPRLQQLESQAKRAAQYNALTRELGETLHGFYAVQWRERTAALVDARSEYERRMQELVRAQSDAEGIESDLDDVRTELQQQREAAGAGESALRDLDDARRRIEQQLQLMEERKRVLVTRISEIADDLAILTDEREELLSGALEESALTGDEELLDDTVAERRRELTTAESDLAVQRRRLAEAEDLLRASRGQAGAVEDSLTRVQRSLRQFDREREDNAGRRNQMLARLRKHGGDALRLITDQRRFAAELAARQVEQGTTRRQAQLAREATERADADLAGLAHQLDAARSRLELLARLRDEHRNSDGALRALVHAAQRVGPETPPRLVAVLSQVIRVQKGLETAIEAALGEQLSAIVVPETLDAQAALAVLEESRAGRATFVPMSELKASHALNLTSERGVLGVASRFIKCDARYRELIDTLLGRVIVVDDIRAGQAMLRRGLGTAVTLDGTVLRPTGIITGGPAGSAGLVLEFERDLEELPGQVEELREAHAARKQDAERMREAMRIAEARLRDGESRIETLQSALRRLEGEAGMVTGAIAGLQGEAAILRGNGAAFADRTAELNRELAEAEEERRRLSLGVRSAQLGVEAARREVEGLAVPVEELRNSLAVVTGARQALEQQRTALARMIEGRRTTLERTERTMATREAELANRRIELEQIVQQQGQARDQLASWTDTLSEQRAILQPIRERVTVLSRRERELFERFTHGRTELLAFERASMEAEAAVNRRAQAIDRLREEMEADEIESPDELSSAEAGLEMVAARAFGGDPTRVDQATTGVGEDRIDPSSLQSRVRSLRGSIRGLGPINAQAEADYDEARERHDFLTSQVQDLEQAEASLQEALEELRRVVRDRFRETFHAVNADFARYFKTFFGGGTARLALTEPEDYGESGVDILAQPPGKRQQHLQLLSGGERSMTAVALLFALLETNPAPFCVLDEVDAALDEANVSRFGDALGELARRTQFILITHNRSTIQAAQSIYGISMGTDGVSTVLSLRLEDLPVGA